VWSFESFVFPSLLIVNNCLLSVFAYRWFAGLAFGLAVGFFATGCNRSNPYLTTQPASVAPPLAGNSNSVLGQWFGGGSQAAALPQQIAAQESELSRRVQMLDENNRVLQTQLAQAQQQIQVANDERGLLRRQLADASNQLQQSRVATMQTQSQLAGLSEQYRGLENSTQLRGGARLTANRSLQGSALSLQQLGFPVLEEGSVIRLRVPADQLFQPNTANLSVGAAEILDRIGNIIRKDFARQRIGVEGHTDAGPFYGGSFTSAQQLASAQATAVVDQLSRRSQLPSQQLFSLAHGTNHTLADNQTPTGRSQNRRIEFVIYADTF
jgi:chemotaxis protein MotB